MPNIALLFFMHPNMKIIAKKLLSDEKQKVERGLIIKLC